MVYYHHVSQFSAPSDDDDPSVEEQISLFEEQIGQRVKAEFRAEQMVRQMLIAQGIDPDAKPELSPELAAKMAYDAERSNDDLFFSGDLESGREFRGKKVKPKDDDFG